MLFHIFLLLVFILGIYSWGFVDLNLHISDSALFLQLQAPLSRLVFHNMLTSAIIYVCIVVGLYLVYLCVILPKESKQMRVFPFSLKQLLVIMSLIVLVSFPAFTYDIFNYMTTARVAFYHKENPYLVMPIEIPNEPALAYTRAANKIALYGPTWLLLTWIPHTLGMGSIWQTIIAFKLLVTLFYFLMLSCIWVVTRSVRQVLFFALNPLVIIEVLLSGHNDIVMMVMALMAVVGSPFVKNIVGRLILWIMSVLVKGATIVLFPLIIWTKIDSTKRYYLAYWLMFGMFLLTPFREELYPWYAIWFLTFASIIPISNTSFIHGFTIALCFGLTLRHVPYIATREYAGSGPMLRVLITLIPMTGYTLWYAGRHGLRKLISSALYGKI